MYTCAFTNQAGKQDTSRTPDVFMCFFSFISPSHQDNSQPVFCSAAAVLSCVQLVATPWTLVHLAPLSMGFSRQEYWSGLLFPPPGDLPNPEIKPGSPASPALAGGFFTPEPSGKPPPSMMIQQLILEFSTCILVTLPIVFFILTFMYASFSNSL